MRWFNGSKQPIYDFEDRLLKSLANNQFQKKVIIGCDSQILDNKVSFVITVVVLSVGHGGIFFYNKQHVDFNSKYLLMQNRLFEQVYRAVEIAKIVDGIIKDTKYRVQQIHCDLNSNKKYKSNKAVAMCVGYITGNNYKAIIKPDAYAASSIADSLTR